MAIVFGGNLFNYYSALRTFFSNMVVDVVPAVRKETRVESNPHDTSERPSIHLFAEMKLREIIRPYLGQRAGLKNGLECRAR